MALPALLGAGMRAAGGAMVKSGGKAMAKGIFGRKDKGAQQAQPEIQEVKVKVVNDKPQTGNQISGMSSFLSLPTAKMIAGGKGKGVQGTEEKLKSIRDLFAERFAYARKRFRQERLEKDRARKEQREKDLEKEEKKEKSKSKIKSALPRVGLFDSIRNFLLYTFLAWLEKNFNFTQQIVKLLPLIGGVMDFVVDWGGKILNGLATFIEVGYGLVDKTRDFVKTIGGDGLLKAFDNILGAINTVLNLLFIYAMAQGALGGGFGGGKGKGGAPGARPRPGTGGRPRVTTTGGRGVGRPDIRNPLRERPKVTTTGGGTAGRPDIRNPLRNRPTVTTGAGKAAGEAAEQITKKTAGKAVGKFIRPFVKRIPVFGALIDFAISVALGESLGRAAARATGAGIGAAAGTAIAGSLGTILGSVVPIVGNFLGGTAGGLAGGAIGGWIGDWIGGFLYDKIAGVKPVQAKSKGGLVRKYEEGGEVDDQEVEKKLLKKDEVDIQKPAYKATPSLSSPKGSGLGGFFANLFGSKEDKGSLSGGGENAGSDYMMQMGEQFKTVPVIGPVMALAVNKLLGNTVKTKHFEAAANSITNFSTLNATGMIESSGDYEKYVRTFNVGGTVDVAAGLGDTRETSRSLSRFLETKFNALSFPTPPNAPARGGPGGGDGTTGPQGVGEYDSATGEYMDYTGGGGLGGGGVYKPILDLIAKYESGPGGYESMYPSTKLPGATKMTIAEVARKATGAVGMYQNMPEFLVGRAKAVGLDPNKDLYNEENQRKIAVYLIEKGQAGVTPQMLKDNPDEAMIRLARVWAAIPVPKDMQGHAGPIKKGQSYYSGVGSNKAHITPEMMYKAMGASVQIQADIASGKLTPGVPGGPGGDPAKGKDGKPIAVSGGSVVAIGKDLVSKGFAVAEHPDFTKKTPAGSYTPGSGHVSNVHKGRGHYEGRAIDVTDWRGSLADSQARYRKVLDSLSGNPSINMLIHDTWGFQDTTGKSGPGGHGHPTHMHIETKKEGGGLIGKSTKEYGNLSQKASYEKGGGTAVVIKPIIIEKQSQNNFMMNPMDKLTFSASERLNNTNAVTSRG